MTKKRVGIIGGTGIGDRLAAMGGRAIAVPTPDGVMRARLLAQEACDLVLVQRHSAGHKTPPHQVNYLAIARGLASLGVVGCFSTAAVGSLRPDWGAGTMAVCHEFLDLTARNLTAWTRTVRHIDFTQPFDPAARKALLGAASELGISAHDGAVYVCGNGPRYETPLEVQLEARMGGDVVGMTAASEAILCRELGVPYACLAIVTNYGAGISPTELTHEEVVAEMQVSGIKAVQMLLKAAEGLAAA